MRDRTSGEQATHRATWWATLCIFSVAWLTFAPSALGDEANPLAHTSMSCIEEYLDGHPGASNSAADYYCELSRRPAADVSQLPWLTYDQQQGLLILVMIVAAGIGIGVIGWYRRVLEKYLAAPAKRKVVKAARRFSSWWLES